MVNYYVVNGEYVKKLRIDTGLSYYDFANLFSVSPQTIQNWENGKTNPNPLQTANMLQLRKRIDNYKNNDVTEVMKAIFIGGGILAFLIWLFNKE